ncbi:MAG: hypothetical protein SFW62_05925 [Alphaproteobacteria bacterium]|nr:hypothetical protein [Alphaproteobacteria bacterium]
MFDAPALEHFVDPSDVDALFACDSLNPHDVCQTLRNFYAAIQSSRHTGLNYTTSHTAEAVAQLVVGHFNEAVRNFGQTPTVDEQARLAALGQAFQKLGGAMDELDNARYARGEPPYHNTNHGLLVMAVNLVVGRAQRKLDGYPGGRGLSVSRLLDEMFVSLASLNHDYAHDGTNNRATGAYVPGRLELISHNLLEPILKEAGASAQDMLRARWMTFATDPDLPGKITEHAAAHVLGYPVLALSRKALDERIDALPPEDQSILRAFRDAMIKDPFLAEASVRLKGCDMVPSFGLSVTNWCHESLRLNAEMTALDSSKPIVTADGSPVAAAGLFVQWAFIGAEVTGSQAAVQAGPRVRFMHPVVDYLFGAIVRKIQAANWNAVPEPVRQSIMKAAFAGYDLKL